MDMNEGHGQSGKGDIDTTSFTNLIDPPTPGRHRPADLAILAEGMVAFVDDPSDGPDPEENLYVPAGYTYFGQFIDHDLTLDITSTLDPADLRDPSRPANDPVNRRSPRFDLDCVYGTGPGDEPFMYAQADDAVAGTYAGATLMIEEHDLSRAKNGRAIIGDKRNDENSIVNQIQQLFIRFHNKVVSDLARAHPMLRGGKLFEAARDEVRWAYQRIILDDFLPRIVDAATLDSFRQSESYALYTKELRDNLPREFVAAAYRFGHSGVRTGYRLNGMPGPGNGTRLPIFTNPPKGPDSLLGFDPLPETHVIDDWGRLFPSDFPRPGQRVMSNVGEEAGDGGDGTVRLQFAYKIDPTLADPLANLPPKVAKPEEVMPSDVRNPDRLGPSLALLNLLRGNRYGLHSGQDYARKARLPVLDRRYLCVRRTREAADGSKLYTMVPISKLALKDGPELGPVFDDDTPLWFYLLAEAQKPIVDYWIDNGRRELTEEDLRGLDARGAPMPPIDGLVATDLANAARQQVAATRCAGTQLGGVGGRIVTEVFYGLLDSDDDSIRGGRIARSWQPIFGSGPATMTKLLRYVDPARAPKDMQAAATVRRTTAPAPELETAR